MTNQECLPATAEGDEEEGGQSGRGAGRRAGQGKGRVGVAAAPASLAASGSSVRDKLVSRGLAGAGETAFIVARQLQYLLSKSVLGSHQHEGSARMA